MNDADIAAVRSIVNTYMRRIGESWADQLEGEGRMLAGKRAEFVDEFMAGASGNILLNNIELSAKTTRENVMTAVADIIQNEIEKYGHLDYVRFPLEAKYAPRPADYNSDDIEEGLDDDASCFQIHALENIVTTVKAYFKTGKIVFLDSPHG